MVAIAKRNRFRKSVPACHSLFSAMLPRIVTHARISFRHLRPEAREEAAAECVANAFVAFARLVQLDKVDLAYPSVLARYAVAQVKAHRKVGGSLNVKDVLSGYAQRQKGFFVERLDRFDDEENAWREAVVQDTRLAPVPEIVRFRVDFADWLSTLSTRDRRVALMLASGEATGRTARRFGISAGRVSQIRRQLHERWCRYQGEKLALAAAPA